MSSYRRARGRAEEDLHQMGELSPVACVLPDHGSVHGPARWTDAHQTAGGSVRRETGE